MRLPSRLLQRKPAAHKGDFGHIFILAGCAKFSGAAVLSAAAAMRAGAGLVTLGIPKSINSSVIKIKPREVMTLSLPETRQGALSVSGYKQIKDFIKSIDVLTIGPGLSQDRSTLSLARKVISGINKPMVIDADALTAFAELFCRGGFKTRPYSHDPITTILTPHPGEMARLLGISIKKVQADREGIALRFARRHKVTLVLKGHNTVVADSTGNLYINKTGNPGMAKAGSGDVLTGIIAAFLGQGLDDFEAAKYAVYLHGLAGDLAVKEKTQICLLASDIIAKIPEAVKRSS